MIAKIFVFIAILSVAYGGALHYSAPIATVAAAPLGTHLAYAAAPAVAYHAGPAIVAPAPIAYSTGVRVDTVHVPVEQHGYKIAY